MNRVREEWLENRPRARLVLNLVPPGTELVGLAAAFGAAVELISQEVNVELVG